MKRIFCFILVVLFSSCKDSYELPLDVPDTGYLVVDGIINSGEGETVINLSKTVKLVDQFNINYVNDAVVIVEGEDNSSYPLSFTQDGTYRSPGLGLTPSRKYRLRIEQGGKQYLSDFLVAKISPPIDSISWDRDEQGVHIYADAKGNANTSGYYRWDFRENWEFNAAYAPSLIYNSTPLVEYINQDQSADMSKFTCYQQAGSTTIEILSTAKISRDTTHYRFLTIPEGSWKLSVLYAVGLRQYAISKEGFEYLSKMKKNTEQTGSLFDAQPSELRGNITCVDNPAEPVIGFLEVSQVHFKRIFIKRSEVPSWRYIQPCSQISMYNNKDSIEAYGSPAPVVPEEVASNNTILKFFASTRDCIDCTVRGTLTKPDFWP
jgi:hypothetical protein